MGNGRWPLLLTILGISSPHIPLPLYSVLQVAAGSASSSRVTLGPYAPVIVPGFFPLWHLK
jgi:hypothetical protein